MSVYGEWNDSEMDMELYEAACESSQSVKQKQPVSSHRARARARTHSANIKLPSHHFVPKFPYERKPPQPTVPLVLRGSKNNVSNVVSNFSQSTMARPIFKPVPTAHYMSAHPKPVATVVTIPKPVATSTPTELPSIPVATVMPPMRARSKLSLSNRKPKLREILIIPNKHKEIRFIPNAAIPQGQAEPQALYQPQAQPQAQYQPQAQHQPQPQAQHQPQAKPQAKPQPQAKP
jgi:hypothetical protein